MTLVLFDHLTPVCMLVIEAFQSSIAFTCLNGQLYEIPRVLGGAGLNHVAAGRPTPYTGMEKEPEVCHMLSNNSFCDFGHLRLNC